MLISILIPTYNRPDFLIQAIESCLDHEEDNIEIIIGDDSTVANEKWLSKIKVPNNYSLNYFYHTKALGQNENVNFLIRKATGKYSLILHDDDYFVSFGLSKLIAAINYNKVNCIIFGKQLLINNIGEKFKSASLNFDYFRRKEFIGIQKDPLHKVLLQQVPSNSFLFPTTTAKEICFRAYEIVGDACDFDFALRMVLIGECDLNFIDENISFYRLSDTSISKKNKYNSIYFKYKIIEELDIKNIIRNTYQQILKSDINILCGYLSRNNKRNELRNIYFSKKYPFKNRFTLRGLFHLTSCFVKLR